jgi:sugar lactone lactonase YvrE
MVYDEDINAWPAGASSPSSQHRGKSSSSSNRPSCWHIATIAGLAGSAGYADGSGNVARFAAPEGIVTDSLSNTVYVAELSGNRVRRLQYRGDLTPTELVKPSNWYVSLLAGSPTGASGYVNGRGTAVRFTQPVGLARSADGVLYVADGGNHVIRKLIVDGSVTTLAGSTAGCLDGNGTAARFNAPRGVAVDNSGYVYVADMLNNRVRRVSPTGAVSTIAGTGVAGGSDGRGSTATFSGPRACAVDRKGNLYVADGAAGERIRLIQRIISR